MSLVDMMEVQDSGNIPTTALSNIVYDYIWELIANNKLKCGDKISEQRIIKDLNVSRTPIREAIQRLSSEGVVENLLNHSSTIITIDRQFLIDLAVMRLEIDTLAVRLAVYNGSNRDFNRLQKIADECIQAAKDGDKLARISLDMDFHRALAEIGNNRFLLDIQYGLQKKTQLWLIQYTKTSLDLFDTIEDGHYAIINALRNRDMDAALNAVKEHLIDFYNVQEYLEETGLFNN